MKFHTDEMGEEILDEYDRPIPIHECICGADDAYDCSCGAFDEYLVHIGLDYIVDENDYD